MLFHLLLCNFSLFQVFTTSALLEVSKQCQMSQFAILRKWDSGCWHHKKWKLPWKCWAILLNWDRPTSLQNCQELPNFQRTRSWDILPTDYRLHSVLADKNRWKQLEKMFSVLTWFHEICSRFSGWICHEIPSIGQKSSRRWTSFRRNTCHGQQKSWNRWQGQWYQAFNSWTNGQAQGSLCETSRNHHSC